MVAIQMWKETLLCAASCFKVDLWIRLLDKVMSGYLEDKGKPGSIYIEKSPVTCNRHSCLGKPLYDTGGTLEVSSCSQIMGMIGAMPSRKGFS